MKALMKVARGVGHVELRDVLEPVPGEGEVLLKVLAAGVCGTDIHVRDDNFPYWPPVILGHEFCGEVVELGKGVAKLAIGDRVVGEPHTRSCGRCHLCRTGNIQICPDKRSPGWGIDGAMTEFLVMPENLLHTIPGSVSDISAAVIEPVANVVTDLVERTRLQAGETVAVVGPGPIGLLSAMVARASGASVVAIIGTPSDKAVRLAKGTELGFDCAYDCTSDDVASAVKDATNGVGADVVVECSGSKGGVAMAIDLVRKQGRVCAIGLSGAKTMEFPYSAASFKVCEMLFCLSTYYTSWDKSIRLVASGGIDPSMLVTHVRKLDEWSSVFDDIDAQKAIKAVLIP